MLSGYFTGSACADCMLNCKPSTKPVSHCAKTIRTSAIDPQTSKIDTSVLTTGIVVSERSREPPAMLDSAGSAESQNIWWGDVIKRLGEHSNIWVDAVEFASEVIKALESEGIISVVGERDFPESSQFLPREGLELS
ncbi:hypothetical protein EV363DRAFT_402517 [Boletus edulis]|uniref:Uncharacterized protein n=1 Tax=Boletus edulis BED1 TaxID=1328754 RepID=A0AAD4GNG1_BOLED|nr:hypothetical protein EV363DRAFT_402517 [Boletus edulis]KAF8452694.1 hypothetical protein L210DRAFT_3639171 [Boletus edulis BED1]